jgi:type II secretory pathway pseudopilin PulG
MNTDNWIDIMGIVATLLGTLISTLVPLWYTSRRERAKASQEVTQSQNQTERERVTLRPPYAIYLASTIAIAISVVALIQELNKPDTVTRTEILRINYYFATAAYHILMMNILVCLGRIARIGSRIDFIMSYLDKVTDALILLQSSKRRDSDKTDIDET